MLSRSIIQDVCANASYKSLFGINARSNFQLWRARNCIVVLTLDQLTCCGEAQQSVRWIMALKQQMYKKDRFGACLYTRERKWEVEMRSLGGQNWKATPFSDITPRRAAFHASGCLLAITSQSRMHSRVSKQPSLHYKCSYFVTLKYFTRSSAVVEGPCDAACIWVIY